MEAKELFYGYDQSNIYLDRKLALTCVKDCAEEYLGKYDDGAALEEARKGILEFIEGEENDTLVFAPNTSEALNKFFKLCNWKKGGLGGDKVLIPDVERDPLKETVAKYAKVVLLPCPNYKIDTAAITKALEKDRKIKLVVLSATNGLTGYNADIKAVHTATKKAGAVLVVDYSHRASFEKPSLKECDVAIYSGFQMYAPLGIAVIAGKKEYFESNNCDLGGTTLFINKKGEKTWTDVPNRHEVGMQNALGATALLRAHTFLYASLGVERLEEHYKELSAKMAELAPKLEMFGYRVFFTEEGDKAPIMVLENRRLSNAETVKMLGYDLTVQEHVLVGLGDYGYYRLIERAKGLDKEKIESLVEGKLNDRYSLIRLEGNLLTTPEDIEKAINKLIEINKITITL